MHPARELIGKYHASNYNNYVFSWSQTNLLYSWFHFQSNCTQTVDISKVDHNMSQIFVHTRLTLVIHWQAQKTNIPGEIFRRFCYEKLKIYFDWTIDWIIDLLDSRDNLVLFIHCIRQYSRFSCILWHVVTLWAMKPKISRGSHIAQ